jgi:phosphogluconate dehydratase
VALITDGRMSGASGKVPAAIHISPEACAGGALAKVRDGDLITIDAAAGLLQALVEPVIWDTRLPLQQNLGANGIGMGRELFTLFRHAVSQAEQGATTFMLPQALENNPGDLHFAHADAAPFSDEDFAWGQKS